jgi:hypothetical protein
MASSSRTRTAVPALRTTLGGAVATDALGAFALLVLFELSALACATVGAVELQPCKAKAASTSDKSASFFIGTSLR